MKLRFLKDIPEKRSGKFYLKDHVYEFPNNLGLYSLAARDKDGQRFVEQVSDEEEVEITPMPYEENNIEILEVD